jgi:peptidoglycan/xylan/chitin deacetylase (PgdA/CDA1 family)
MKSWKTLNLLVLACLVSCSTTNKVAEETHQFVPVARSIATIEVALDEISKPKVTKTIQGIFHSYIYGQVLIHEFDKFLDKNPSSALTSNAYNELQAIRPMVDGFEDKINDMYLSLVMVSALPKYNDEQKINARATLKIIGQFLDGITSDNKELPDNLKHLVLGNLREKQTFLYNQLMTMSNDPSITQNAPEVIAIIHENMVLLRATRMKFYKDLQNYKVDDDLLNQAIADLTKDKDFTNFKTEVKKASKEIKRLNRAISKGRSTSSDTIYPNASSAGNITGNGYPANTWSLTYDDGPGGKTTPTVLQNLKDHNMKATFFMLAKQVEGLPNTAKSVADAGMDLASHSYDHAQLTKVGPIALEKQIGGAKKIIEEKLGKPIKLFRLPYGAGVNVSSIRAKIAAHGMIHVFWNVDTLDWQDKNPTSIFNRAVKQMKATSKNNGVVLFHDIHAQSVIASELLMDYFEEQKINVCTVQSVVDQLNKGLATCQP